MVGVAKMLHPFIPPYDPFLFHFVSSLIYTHICQPKENKTNTISQKSSTTTHRPAD